jgi:hypothetical protein
MDHSLGPIARVCPDHGHRLVPIAFHPGVFEHGYCPPCDQALVWLGEHGEAAYAGTRQTPGWKIRRIGPQDGPSQSCARGEFRLHRTWITKGIALFLEGRGQVWTLCHDGEPVEPVAQFLSATEHEIRVTRCPECRTFNVFLLDPMYGEEILGLFPWNEEELPDIRKLELFPIRYHEIDAAMTMAILDEVLRRLLPPPKA